MPSPVRRSKASAEMGAPYCRLAQRDVSGWGNMAGAQIRSTPSSHAVARVPPLLEKVQHVTGASCPCRPYGTGLRPCSDLQISTRAHSFVEASSLNVDWMFH